MVKVTVDKPWMCKQCGYTMDRCGQTNGGDAAPDEEDLSLCLNCGALYVRQTDRWRPITTREFTALPEDLRAYIARAQWLRKRVIREDLSQRDRRV